MNTPLFLLAITYILALVAGIFWNGGILFCVILLLLGVGSFFLLRRFSLPPLVCALIFVFALGYSYGEFREYLTAENPFAGVENTVLSGYIVDDPIVTERSLKCTMKVDSLENKPLDKAVKVTLIADKSADLAYGDEVTASGSFLVSGVDNPGGFDYSRYQEQHRLYGTFSVLYQGSLSIESNSHFGNPLLRFSYWLKSRFERSLSYLPKMQRDIIKGIFFGDTSGLDYHTNDVLTKSGIRHSFAVSGLHVGYVLLFLNGLGSLLHLSRGKRFALILPCLFFYAAMTGFSPSVLRASFMCLMALGGGIFGRERNSFNGLAAAALVLLLWDPLLLTQAGFQLSFLAIFSILFFGPRLKQWLPWEFPGKDAFLVTVAAQLGMIPILAYLFHVVSLVSFFVSSLCCLLVGGMVLLCFGAMILSVVLPAGGVLLLIPCGILGQGILEAMDFCVTLPFACLYKGDFGIVWLLLVYGILLLLFSASPLRFRGGLATGLTALVFIVFLFPGFGGSGDLEVTFLSVGEADAIYISTPQGDSWLMDAGDPKEGSVGYYTIRPFLLSKGIDTLDGVILSHNDDDHSGAVPYLAESFGIERYVFPTAAEDYFEDVIALADSENAEVDLVSAGDVLELADGVTLEILGPESSLEGESNELSLVGKLRYGSTTLLFTGDVEGVGLQELLAEHPDLRADILKIPHHGSKNSYDEEFYRAVDPNAVVISVGKNSYGHPDASVETYWQRKSVPCYRTDYAGAVTVTSDGRRYEITAYHDEVK